MEKFEKANYVEMPAERIKEIAKSFGVPEAEVIRTMVDERLNTKIFVNDKYQVAMRTIANDDPEVPSVVHLSIKRLDKEPIHDWRDLQKIKNELVGAEIEMWECYPKESQLIDTANQYHMWGFLTEQKIIPFGFNEGRKVIDHDPVNEIKTNTKQRKL